MRISCWQGPWIGVKPKGLSIVTKAFFSRCDNPSGDFPLNLGMARAGRQVVVDHAGGLHEGVADGRADELEAGPAQRLAHRIRLRRFGRHFGQRRALVLDRRAIDKAPEEFAERLPVGGQRQVGTGVLDGGGDLGAVADDAGIGEQRGDFLVAIAGDQRRFETVEGAPVVFPLLEYRRPRQAGLRAFEDQQFEEGTVVMERDAPFLVVVFAVKVKSFAPGAAFHGNRLGGQKRSLPPGGRIDEMAKPRRQPPSGYKAVADTGFGEDVLRPRRIVLDLLPEMPHIDANVVAVLGMGWAPNGLQELAMGEDGIGIGDQVGQQPEFDRRQVNRLPILFDDAFAEVDANVAELENRQAR